MAYIRRLPSGLYRAEVERRGVRDSQSFRTKSAAQQWATRREAEILDGAASRWPRKTVRDALDKHRDADASASARRNAVTCEAFLRDFPELAGKIISDVTTADLADWRAARLAKVSPGTVKREATYLRSVWTLAAKEWGWVPWPHAWAMLRVPSDNPPRTRLLGWRECKAILRALYYRTGVPPVAAMQQVGWAFLVALRTGMRSGEVLGLTADDVRGSVAVVKEHKTRHLTGKPRLVPLTPQAARLLGDLARWRGAGRLLPVAASSADALFRRAVGRTGIDGVQFRDSRATALTHLAGRVSVLDLAKIAGHANLKELARTYYRPDAEAIADRLKPARRAAPTASLPRAPKADAGD